MDGERRRRAGVALPRRAGVRGDGMERRRDAPWAVWRSITMRPTTNADSRSTRSDRMLLLRPPVRRRSPSRGSRWHWRSSKTPMSTRLVPLEALRSPPPLASCGRHAPLRCEPETAAAGRIARRRPPGVLRRGCAASFDRGRQVGPRPDVAAARRRIDSSSRSTKRRAMKLWQRVHVMGRSRVRGGARCCRHGDLAVVCGYRCRSLATLVRHERHASLLTASPARARLDLGVDIRRRFRTGSARRCRRPGATLG